jgi:hypothetical protein
MANSELKPDFGSFRCSRQARMKHEWGKWRCAILNWCQQIDFPVLPSLFGLLAGLFPKPNSELSIRAMLGTPHRMTAGDLAGLRIPGARVQSVIADQESNLSHTFVRVNFRDHC